MKRYFFFWFTKKAQHQANKKKELNIPRHIAYDFFLYEEIIPVPSLDVHCKNTFKYIE